MANEGVFPQRELNTGNTPYNAFVFAVMRLVGKINVATLVQVVAVHVPGAVSPVGTVDVKPLVNQLDGSDVATQHGTVFGIPYLRIQGGTNAVICDPKIDDIGLCVFADRDISSVKATGKQSNPGSKRRFSFSDGFYFGGWNSLITPSRYLIISDAGLKIVAPETVEIDAPLKVIGDVQIVGNLEVDGTVLATQQVTGQQGATFTGEVSAIGTSLHAHVHTGVQSGSSNTGYPL